MELCNPQKLIVIGWEKHHLRCKTLWGRFIQSVYSPKFRLKKVEKNARNRRWGSHDGDAWLITVVNKSPKARVVGPLANGRFMACMAVSWLVNGGDPNHLLAGMVRLGSWLIHDR